MKLTKENFIKVSDGYILIDRDAVKSMNDKCLFYSEISTVLEVVILVK